MICSSDIATPEASSSASEIPLVVKKAKKAPKIVKKNKKVPTAKELIAQLNGE